MSGSAPRASPSACPGRPAPPSPPARWGRKAAPARRQSGRERAAGPAPEAARLLATEAAGSYFLLARALPFSSARRSALRTNGGATAGSALFLTKPLGVGILSTAQKQGVLKDEDFRTIRALMLTPNDLDPFGTLTDAGGPHTVAVR